jgi:hypothetical protein
MILFQLTQTSIDASVAHIQHVEERILVGIRLGMRDGVKGLAQAEVEAAAPHRKSGLLEKILGRAGRVIETDTEIVAAYRPRNAAKQPHYWLEYGVDIPAVEDTLMAMNIGGETLFRRGHKEHTLRAQPFFFAAAEGYEGQFYERLSARVQEAMNA